MTYKVKYKKQNQLFYRTLKKVKGDGITEFSYRFFILDDETRIEIPLGYLFRFGKERFMVIKQNMEQESGQKIPVKEN